MKMKCFLKGKLRVRVYKTRDELGRAAALDAANRLKRIIRRKGEATVVFAAAPSQNELLEHLSKADVDWTKVRALHQDEYVGIADDEPAGFGNFLDRAIFKALPFKEIHYLKGETPEKTLADYTELLKKYPPDMILLGVGENGHLAFNDPAVADFNDPLSVKIVELDDVCRMQQVNDGCFKTFDDVPKKAFTLTMSTIASIPEKITVVPGEKKANAVKNLLEGEISTKCPASIARTYKGCALYLDECSASLLNSFGGQL